MKKLLLLCFLVCVLLSCRLTTQLPKNDFIVCLTFDDHCLSVYQNALPIMQQYGFRGSVFVNSGRVGNPRKMSWEQLDSLKHTYNWEVGGHTTNHEALSLLTIEQAEQAITTDFQNLQAHGLDPVSFATTFGYCPVEYYDMIKHYYRNIRTCFNTSMRCPIERTSVGSFGVTNYMQPQIVMGRITQGRIEQENLVVLLFHEIGYQNTDYLNNYTPADFSELLLKLHQKNIRVLPLNEALDCLSD